MTDSLWITNDLVALSGWCELLNFLSALHAWFLLKISSSASFRSPLFNREELLPISISLLCTQLGSSTAFLQFVKRSVHLFLPFTFILDRLSWLGYANDFKKHFLNSYVNLLYISFPAETFKHIPPHTADWNNAVHFGSQGEIFSVFSHSLSSLRHVMHWWMNESNIVMLWAAVLHPWAGGRHSRWTQSAETCSGQWNLNCPSEPNRRSSSGALASFCGKKQGHAH